MYFPALGPLLVLRPPVLVPNLYFLFLAPNLHLPALVYNSITSPGPEFCIYRPFFLNLGLYLPPWPTICITGLVPEFAFTLLSHTTIQSLT